MKPLEQLVRERVEQRLRQRERDQLSRKMDRIVAVAIINGVLRDLGVTKSMEEDRRVQALARFERGQRRQQERDHRLAVRIINGVMARLGMPWPEIEAKAARGWRGGGGLRRRMERY